MKSNYAMRLIALSSGKQDIFQHKNRHQQHEMQQTKNSTDRTTSISKLQNHEQAFSTKRHLPALHNHPYAIAQRAYRLRAFLRPSELFSELGTFLLTLKQLLLQRKVLSLGLKFKSQKSALRSRGYLDRVGNASGSRSKSQ